MNNEDTTVYRGRTVEELLPRIREELGPDAIVVAQREGLAGGVGGFFQHAYVEIEARPGTPGGGLVDTYDEPEAATDFAAELQAAALLDEAQRITAEAAFEPAPEPAPEPEAPAAPADPKASRLTEALVAAGLPEATAADIVAEAVSHGVPFASPRQLKRLVRAALARRIAVAPGYRGRRRALAIVGAAGAGKTHVAARIVAAYEEGSDLDARLIELHGAGGLPLAEGVTVVDTPAAAPRDAARVAELAAALEAVELDEIHLAIPATLSAPAAVQLLDGLAPLRPTHLVLTHADETGHLGPVIGLAVERGLPFSFVGRGDGVEPADASDLAAALLA